MRLAYSTFRRPDKVTYHIPGRTTTGKGHTERAERTWCGVVLGGGWKVAELDREPTCERCIAFRDMAEAA